MAAVILTLVGIKAMTHVCLPEGKEWVGQPDFEAWCAAAAAPGGTLVWPAGAGVLLPEGRLGSAVPRRHVPGARRLRMSAGAGRGG
jgi:hypothetical protein